MFKFILFAFLFFIVFIILSAVGMFLKLFTWGSSSSNKSRNSTSQGGMNNSGNAHRNSASPDGSEKVFNKDEGEYVDFVEIREEEEEK